MDYGHLYRTKTKNVRSEIYAQHIPIQAFCAELSGVRPLGPGNTWTDSALDFIQDKVRFLSYRGFMNSSLLRFTTPARKGISS